MSLTSIMSGAGLTTYPIIALILFLSVFVLVCVRVFRKSQRAHNNAVARIPLEDGEVPRHKNTTGGTR